MKASMTPRQGILAALNHQEVDRIPTDLGGRRNTTICTGPCKKLKTCLGVNRPTVELNETYEWPEVEEAVLGRLAVDTRAVFAKPPTRDRTQWLDARTFVGDWGTTWHRPENQPQYHMIAHPLAESTIEDLDSGYVPAAVHNVEDDVPPEDVWAMLDAGATFHP